MAGEQTFAPTGAPISGRITPAVFPFYTTGEDNLRIVSFNSAAGVKLRLVARLLGVNGRPTPSNWDHTPNTDRSAASTDYPLAGQTLLNLTVLVTAGSPQQGQCFVNVQLIRGIGAAAIVLGNILAADVTVAQGPGFPGSPIESAGDSGGFFRTLTGTAPAVNTNISETVPTGARWEVRGIRCTLTSTVSRRILIRFKDASGNVIGGAWPAFLCNVLPSVNEYIATAGYVQPFSNVLCPFQDIVSNLPYPMVLLAGGSISVEYDPVGFQFSAPTYLVRETLDV